MNTLEKLLIEEISLAERERDQCEAKIKGLNQKILDYRTALNHARDSDFSLNKKARNIRFQSSPRQLVAHILKKQPEKWFHTNEITLQALKLDNQSTDNGVQRLHLQTIHSTLNHLVKHSLVEKKLEGKICYWRLQAR
ncbi:transcriptional regulator [Otariodibacter sp.]|uniref:transcriptional regulator n=1 Tax=Otariodibacter sp. TaxID=3030919 RepID=UPI0026316D36|nr:transcriptional regulator [Otariodibacter sp.]